MKSPDARVLELFRQMQLGQSAEPDDPRAALEASLLPLVRVAMRGIGHPNLVRWAREQTPAPGAAPARDLARRLCDRLMERLDPLQGRETVASH
jgi:hypothetical protein